MSDHLVVFVLVKIFQLLPVRDKVIGSIVKQRRGFLNNL
jgi:hypothetical protein